VRIGLLTTSFPRWPGDVAGHFVLGFAAALAGRGHRVEVIAPEPAEAVAPPSFAGIEVVHVPYVRPRSAARTFYGSGVPDNLGRDPRAWLGPLPFTVQLARAVLARRTRWDAVVSHFGLPCGLLASSLCAGRPHLCVQHSADLHLLSRMPARALLASQLVAGASALWFVSERARREFIGWLPHAQQARAQARSAVHAMGIADLGPAPAERATLRAALGIERFALLSVARLVPVKGLAPAIEALAHRDDLEWLIAGQGPERARLEQLARRSRLRVRLLGQVDEREKRQLLHAADAYVLPSRVLASGRSEGMPTALLEALCAGLPAIAADVGGIAEWVRPGETGWLFDPRALCSLEAGIDAVRQAPACTRAYADNARRAVAGQRWSELAPCIEAALCREHRTVSGFKLTGPGRDDTRVLGGGP